MRYTTEYQPQISSKCREFIYNNVNPVFSYDTNGTQMYALDEVLDALSKNIQEPTPSASLEELSLIKDLISEDVSYIEF